MRTIFLFLFIFVAYFIFIFFKTIIKIDDAPKKDRFSELREMPRFSKKVEQKDQEQPEKKEDVKPIIENKINQPPLVPPPVEPTNNNEVQNVVESPTNTFNEDADKVAICFSSLINCRYRDIMFNYPSEENPWSMDKDKSSVECITNVKFCETSNYQILSPEEESSIVNEYNQRRNEENLLKNQPVGTPQQPISNRPVIPQQPIGTPNYQQ